MADLGLAFEIVQLEDHAEVGPEYQERVADGLKRADLKDLVALFVAELKQILAPVVERNKASVNQVVSQDLREEEQKLQ